MTDKLNFSKIGNLRGVLIDGTVYVVGPVLISDYHKRGFVHLCAVDPVDIPRPCIVGAVRNESMDAECHDYDPLEIVKFFTKYGLSKETAFAVVKGAMDEFAWDAIRENAKVAQQHQ